DFIAQLRERAPLELTPDVSVAPLFTRAAGRERAVHERARGFERTQQRLRLCRSQSIARRHLARREGPARVRVTAKQRWQSLGDRAEKTWRQLFRPGYAECIAIDARVFRRDPPPRARDLDRHGAPLRGQRSEPGFAIACAARAHLVDVEITDPAQQ